MAKQTINIGTSPNDGTGTPLRTSFDYCNLNFTELYTALGGGVGLPGATTQVIFNDGGTNLAGDVGLVFDKTTDKLTIAGNVQAASATITGDLTAARLIVTGGTIPTNGLWLATTNTLEFAANSLAQYRIAPLGVFSWFDGAGGTRMTLNSTGLGVGVSPSYNIHARGATDGRIQVEGASGFGMVFIQASSGNTAQLQLNSSGGSGRIFAVNSNSSGLFTISDETAVATRLFIDSSGNVGVGVTPSAWGSFYKAIESAGGASYVIASANVNGVNIASNCYNNNTNWLYKETGASARFSTNNNIFQWFQAPSGTAGNAITFTQAMGLDASGNLLVGTTNTSATAGPGFKAQYSSTVPQFAIVTNEAGSSTALSLYNVNAAAYRFYVNNAGTVFATNVVISAISDARYKENVQDIDVGLAAILSLKPRKFDWKAGKGKDIKGDRGFIAQEFETVFPNLIDEWADPAPEGEAPYKSVRQDLIPVLVKAIQELTARVQTLEAR
jgi:hypothetical protein